MRKFQWLALSLTAVLFAVACSSTKNANKVELRFQPEKGTTYQVDMEVLSTSKVMGMSTKTTMNMGFKMTADDVTEDTVKMATNYTRMAMNMETPMGNMSYDSDNPDGASGMMGERLKPVFDRLLEANLIISFDKFGHVISTTGMEGLFSDMQGMENLDDQMNAADQMGVATASFPKEAVKVGDTWQEQIINTSTAPIVMDATYTVKEITEDMVTLGIEGTISKYEGEGNGSAAKIEKISGDFTGELLIAKNTGWTKSANITQNLQMGMTQGGMPITVDAVNTITMTSK